VVGQRLVYSPIHSLRVTLGVAALVVVRDVATQLNLSCLISIPSLNPRHIHTQIDKYLSSSDTALSNVRRLVLRNCMRRCIEGWPDCNERWGNMERDTDPSIHQGDFRG
jgi:hypothetical protein